ncbi:M23 family metallopeptidase [Nocardioides sp. cx-173]|uniref:M23 family metallopeptidase n=1 Tax=Nocardioides sp. cx-173 TaxID=2898796 RepID=UPI001E2D105A|nr:M23 family metallopeptidase [Nocardioides sp. cx-173]MCD4527019.1 M23 family metallopeptidase [Nocardioides sp. cx-173]UGB41046.1 M23 family metallopeptidase [Nocardioides sp. cx-173]
MRLSVIHLLLGSTVAVGLLGTTFAQPAAAASAPAASPAPALPPYVVREGHTFTPKPKIKRWHLPVTGYRLTGRFGNAGSMWSSTHTGLDFAAPLGTPVRAIERGKVTSTAYDGAYGNKTVVTLPDGTEVWYCHQDTQRVSVGQGVAAGDVIGTVGSTGNSTGPHLHLEVRPGGGDPVDPERALAAHGRRV